MRDAADIDDPTAGTWSAVEAVSDFSVDFELRMDAETATVSFVRLARCGRSILGERLIWQQVLARRRDATGVFEWMAARENDWPFWGQLTGLIGPRGLFAAAAADMARARSDRAAELLRSRTEARVARERERDISSYLVDKGGQFGVDMRRGGQKEGFFVLWFRENWERERFRDWWRQQQHRFADFADLHDAQGAPALERMLLREMQDTEKRIKAAGLGAGGRRPLRFYRGDE